MTDSDLLAHSTPCPARQFKSLCPYPSVCRDKECCADGDDRRVRELEDALRPFAVDVGRLGGSSKETSLSFRYATADDRGGLLITVGDLRRAATALRGKGEA